MIMRAKNRELYLMKDLPEESGERKMHAVIWLTKRFEDPENKEQSLSEEILVIICKICLILLFLAYFSIIFVKNKFDL